MRHFLDRVASVLVAGAGVGGAPARHHLEVAGAFARGHHLAAVARGLGHEHVLVLAGEALDVLAGSVAPDFLLGHIEEGNRQRGGPARAHEVPQGMEGDVGTALHVVDAGSVDDVAVARHRTQALESAHRMHGVRVREDQDAGTRVGLGAPRDQDVPVAVAAGNALDAGSDAAQILLHPVHHPVDRGGIVGRRLDVHPTRGFRQDLVGVELRNVLFVGHGSFLVCCPDVESARD